MVKNGCSIQHTALSLSEDTVYKKGTPVQILVCPIGHAVGRGERERRRERGRDDGVRE